MRAEGPRELHRQRRATRHDAPVPEIESRGTRDGQTSTPGWSWKRASSAASSACTVTGFKSRSGTHRARVPSSARTSRRVPAVPIGDDERPAGRAFSQLTGQRRRQHRGRHGAAEETDEAPPSLQHHQRPPTGARRSDESTGAQATIPIFTKATNPELAHHCSAFARTTFGVAGPTVNRVAAVRPRTSGAYMHSARVGGTTKSPGVVARARY